MDLVAISVFLTEWSDLLGLFEGLGNDLIGNPLLIGLIILLFFQMFALALFFPFGALIVIDIPILFAVFNFIPDLRIVVAILFGILIGIGLIKWYKNR